MFRQSEERTYKLSAVDDFALRPKKKETANEPARPKLFNDQRQFYRGESHPSHSSRPTPTSTKPQSISFNGNARPGSSLVIDLTKDDHSRPPLTRPKPQLPPQNHAPDGITIVNQKVQRSADENPAMPLERKGFVAVNDRQLCDDPPLSQPGGISQARHGPSVEQARDSQTPKLPRDVILNTPTMQPTPKPTKETFPEAPTNRQKPNGAALSNGSESVHMNFSDTSIHQRDLPAIRGHQASNEIRQTPPSEKHSGPTNPDSGASNTQHTMAKKPPKSTVQAKSILNAPVTPQLETTVIAPPQRTVTPQGPLSALLGGREWKKMSPEERRLFWVSQHNTEKFDSQIYSEHNRPFRPGDALFGVTDDAFAPRPNQPAKHFDYIDPRIHYANQPSQEHYQQQQKQISARGNRKTHFGQAIKRAAQKKRASLKPDQTRKQAILPRRVQENPKWLAALGVLEKLEAQKRDKDRAKLGQGKANDKAKATTTATIDVDCDVVMESS
ncbi:hypothetical protein NUW58_g9163 [Xylaria curta]|uniref:Uncharacterized protein n=1 Tax=Xylaria curta TaxID=42375 RepID=A0ACC1MZT9_9PEZI|nr:hypothetical protein NUW58_g9163 [Xylaria curta]